MALSFDDNELKCPKCGCNVFKQEKTFCVDKFVTKFKETAYREMQPKYSIICTNCNTVVVQDDEKIIK